MEQSEIEFFQKEGIVCNGLIAKGGYGVVFDVYSTQYKDRFALKKIPEDLFNESEIDCLKAIDDPRIVHLYKYYKFNNSVYMLIEFCPNDLEKLLKSKQKFSDDELLRIANEVILGVKACHDRMVAHCDIKPSNFMIDKYGRTKICDFGLSTIYAGNPTSSAFKGTVIFMAPEIFKLKGYNPFAADMWAIGVTLYYLATNTLPFFDANHKKAIQKIMLGQYDDSNITNPIIKHMISRCLEMDSTKRATVYELLQSLEFLTPKEPTGLIPMSKSNPMMRSSHLIIKPSLGKKPAIAPQTSSLSLGRMKLANNFTKSALRII